MGIRDRLGKVALFAGLTAGCGSAPATTALASVMPAHPREIVTAETLPPGTEPYRVELPASVPPMPVPADNPLTVQGVALGRWLFYDPILSGNDTQACADCHQQRLSFTDGRPIAIGSEGKPARRNTLPLVNLAWQTSFFWDGRVRTLEEQVLVPIQDPLEMNQDLDGLIEELRKRPEYPRRFEAAFGDGVTRENLAKALAQFLRTLVSFDSGVDRLERGEYTPSALEQRGMEVLRVTAERTYGRAHFCDPCHRSAASAVPDAPAAGLYNASEFRGIGLADPDDAGRQLVTGLAEDAGRFKVPTVRNVMVTGPYMHDGRFATLRDVIEYYNERLPDDETLDDQLKFEGKPVRMHLTKQDIDAVLAAAELYTDRSFLSNPAFSNPFQAGER